MLRHQISRSEREIRMRGVMHGDPHLNNMSRNAELRRVLIIDFHRSKTDPRPRQKRPAAPLPLKKRSFDQVGMPKRTSHKWTEDDVSTTEGSNVQGNGGA
ncbi:hypothetical protein ACJ73_05799 [Blastomyces percursus]|uniref:Uncharacterized protein n=1 Tax=Blastomyces percursus TaxID=1658174 RepID=A0A1J9Q2U8_9EURO|nr:hypothetical protein ACJ73_05799 [Blastomyces percursus]